MKGFYHIWAWRPSWSCDLDFLYTHWFPLPIDASNKIWLWLAKPFQRRRSLKLWTDGRTTDGRTPDHGHPKSSPCEPHGSGELKMVTEMRENFADMFITFICFSLIRSHNSLWIAPIESQKICRYQNRSHFSKILGFHGEMSFCK